MKTAGLKASAREMLFGKYGTLVGAVLIQLVLYFVCVMAIAEINSVVMVLAIQIIVNLLMGVIISGKVYMFMNVVYGQTVSLGDLFFGFRQNPDKAIIIQLAHLVMALILQTPYNLFLLRLWDDEITMSVTTLVLLVPYIIVNVGMSQAFYLLHDFPDRSAVSLIKSSFFIMKKQYWKYIGLLLSFIPLILLGTVTLFIPLLWVNCYLEASCAQFYKELIATKGDNQQIVRE